MYNPKSGKATEFIDDREILDSLEYAQKNKNNKEVIDAILEKASAMKGHQPQGGCCFIRM